MCDVIGAVPTVNDNMINQVLAIVRNQVSDIWSPPRVILLAVEYGPKLEFANDIQANDENGEPWDFYVPAQRAKCTKHIIEQQPSFVTGNQMRT